MNTEKTGSFIAKLRKEKGWTQAQLAEQLHISDKAVSRWETGRGFPDIGSLEELSEKLDVSVAELLHGEKIPDALPAEEVKEITDSSYRLVKELFSRQQIRNLLLSFLTAAVLLTALLVHLNAPRFLPASEAPAEVSVLENGQIIAILNENVSGCDVETITTEEGKEIVSLGCYKTLLGSLHKNGQQIVLLGEKGKTFEVWLYPGKEGDVLLYSEAPVSSGVETLPRLIYNYWILLSVIAALVLGVLAFALRRKHYGPLLLKLALLPLCFAFSAIVLLTGSSASVYDAAYYFSGMLAMTILLYAVLLLLLDMLRKKRSA